jgi:hypothetical protein
MEVVKQRSEFDCVLACLCMATGKEYNELWTQEFAELVEAHRGTAGSLHEQAVKLSGLVAGEDFETIYCIGIRPEAVLKLLWGRHAMLQVPSLNHEGKMHYIYWDGERILDPSNKQTYQYAETVIPYWVTLLRTKMVRQGDPQ